MEIHEFAHVFPMVPLEKIRLLAADILINGLRKPIMLHPDGRILDGRARYLACEMINVTPMVTTWNGVGSPFVLLTHLNLEPRQLTMAQRALVAGRIYYMQPLGQKETLQQKDLAALLNITDSAVHRARQVIQRGVVELIDGVFAGTITLCAAREVAQLPAHEQRSIVVTGQTAHTAEARRNANIRSTQKEKLVGQIRQLAADGHDSEQIASELNISHNRCRLIIKRMDIDCPGDRAHHRSRRHDPERILDHIVMDADSLFVSESLIDFDELSVPSARLAEWITTLDVVRDRLGSFIRKLRKEQKRHDDHKHSHDHEAA